ncbi:hypothetical protein LMG28688_01074 [Paraburkholderia caffeinitolerans]|uniref:Uncharacterized protein n=2 Tax=Burkholderiaceae TaxID=119060 RepID=A0A6J5FIP3_9BURK|nr:hypothetical protein LMG28688_01074 [Paraburkholderia caffeinitolerans]
MEPVTARTFADALMNAFVIHGPILMRRIDSRAVWAALLFSLSLAACGGSDSDGSSASPSARSQQTGQQTGQQNSEQNSPQSGQQMAGADANANPGAEDKPPGAPEMHWAPGSGTSSAH